MTAQQKAAAEPDPEGQPVSSVRWVPRDQVHANSWNPNHVAPPELELLIRSIEEDGWTQPIVVQQDGPESFEVVDGFHRWKVSGTDRIAALTGDRVPVVVVTLDPAHARMSTIRHNRARGTHGIAPMADIVVELATELGLSEQELMDRLGMEREEVRRLSDRGSVLKRIAGDSFEPAWRSAPKLDGRKAG